ncbi:MAG: 50S ribosomal protein L32 [Acidobacteriota bacterium]|nr:50S ribosomal protein L32 [Acidobacteriota bacterium]
MAVPKRRTSVSRRNKRRSHHALSAMAVNSCKHCGALRRPHRVCEACGYYDGKQIAVGAED